MQASIELSNVVLSGPRLSRRPPYAPKRRPLRAVAFVKDEEPAAAVSVSEGNKFVERPPRLPIADTILMEGFGWESHRGRNWWRTLEEKIPDLLASGITHLWLPPPSESVSPQGYLPEQLYKLDSAYGTSEELHRLCRKLLEAGIRPVADIVINHRCADHQDPRTGIWNRFGDDVDHEGRRLNWGTWAIANTDPDYQGTGGKDTGDDYGAAPDLDHNNPDLRAGLVDWMTWLHKHVGFEGWRFDFVRGYAAVYTKEYIEKSLGTDTFCVGENFVDLRWEGSHLDENQDPARQRLCDWVNKAGARCALFDFVLKGQLQEAVKRCQYNRLRDSQDKPNGLLGWWPTMAVTFVDNHDTGSTQQHWPFPISHVELGYAYILTHPGVPCLFIEHYLDGRLASTLRELVDIRKEAGIRADSKVSILAAEPDLYVARVGERLTVKLGPRFEMGGLLPKKEEGWELAKWGPDYAIWLKKAKE